ncbi:hydantoinase/carbamoylase family amidase [Terrilactibacillus sp. BCM23-1]|uniref:Hydantoinase/carbamoylase family amidase n=1 Tax=Terrilactibacillus tamarindi TaxID=2599694 RepID=A0A6N8CMB5_9BACI|nr:Zn-dependent hydrolase [Terrilactibacillus tamarindi]MTT31162.1 hydantoinase/carbamoylase family amidase [Terrilactibacillus tamarindi]
MITTNLSINRNRLENQLKILSQFGRNEEGGIDRTTFTPAELEARKWLIEQFKAINLNVKVDEAANIWATRKGYEGLPHITFGSHIDSVPNGGIYDGALGVLISLEIMTRLYEAGKETRHPFTCVSFSAEEPNPFGLSTFGSRIVTKRLRAKDIKGIKNKEGLPLEVALNSAGGDFDNIERAQIDSKTIAAFLELHIEQGKRLERNQIPIGVVTSITGIYREKLRIIGEANHAGTTMMNDRKDALTTASECILLLESICRDHPSDEVVGTIGELHIKPNAANIIPEEVELTVEIRGKTEEEIRQVVSSWECALKRVFQNRKHMKLDRQVFLNQPPSPMDRDVIDSIETAAKQLSLKTLRLGSMAGHDATHMATITRSGMIFVPSQNGKSHCPDEFTGMDDIEKAANTMLHTLLLLDQSLNNKEGS